MAMPIIALVGWSCLVIFDRYKRGWKVWSGFCVLILGLALILAGYNILKVKWRHYRFKRINLVSFFVVLVLVSTYEFMVVFGYDDFDDESKEKFLPYSAIFLNFNVMILGVAIFLEKYKDVKGVNHIIRTHFPIKNIVLNRDRDENLLEEI